MSFTIPAFARRSSRVQLTSPEAAKYYDSEIRVFDARTGKLKRIEKPANKKANK